MSIISEKLGRVEVSMTNMRATMSMSETSSVEEVEAQVAVNQTNVIELSEQVTTLNETIEIKDRELQDATMALDTSKEEVNRLTLRVEELEKEASGYYLTVFLEDSSTWKEIESDRYLYDAELRTVKGDVLKSYTDLSTSYVRFTGLAMDQSEVVVSVTNVRAISGDPTDYYEDAEITMAPMLYRDGTGSMILTKSAVLRDVEIMFRDTNTGSTLDWNYQVMGNIQASNGESYRLSGEPHFMCQLPDGECILTIDEIIDMNTGMPANVEYNRETILNVSEHDVFFEVDVTPVSYTLTINILDDNTNDLLSASDYTIKATLTNEDTGNTILNKSTISPEYTLDGLSEGNYKLSITELTRKNTSAQVYKFVASEQVYDILVQGDTEQNIRLIPGGATVTLRMMDADTNQPIEENNYDYETEIYKNNKIVDKVTTGPTIVLENYEFGTGYQAQISSPGSVFLTNPDNDTAYLHLNYTSFAVDEENEVVDCNLTPCLKGIEYDIQTTDIEVKWLNFYSYYGINLKYCYGLANNGTSNKKVTITAETNKGTITLLSQTIKPTAPNGTGAQSYGASVGSGVETITKVTVIEEAV